MQTTLEREVSRMQRVVDERIANFDHSRKAGEDDLLRIFQRHSRSKMDHDELERIRRAISAARALGKPIPVGILWAVGGHSRNHFKFLEPDVLLPRLGDFWFVFWCRMLDAKVRLFHEHGIEIVVADELPQSALMGWTREETYLRRAPVEAVAAKHAPFIRFIDLPAFEREREGITVGEPPPSFVYAVVCSLAHVDLPESAYQWQYACREKPWEDVHAAIPKNVWEQARAVAIEMTKVSQARKETDWLHSVIGRPYIDASITAKGRFTPDIWEGAFPQHGGTILKARDAGQFSVRIEPESRLLGNGHEPVSIRASELHAEVQGSYVFYWQERR